MQPRFRLRRRGDFAAIYRKGRAWSNDVLVLRVLPNDLDHCRFGFAVSRKVGNAVVRNRLRRRLREQVRSLPFEPGQDVVVIARPAAADLTSGQLRAAVEQNARRGRLLSVAN
jgi:ribonuclease P protein component